MKQSFLFQALCFSILFSPSLFAQANSTSVIVTNEDNKATTFTADDIKAMPQTTLEVQAHDSKMHSYSGVYLSTLLLKAGVSIKDSSNRNKLNKYLLITASDGYKVIYALTEADTALSDKKIILADVEDGKPLAENAAPFQIIATGEKKQARMVRHVTNIAVRKGY